MTITEQKIGKAVQMLDNMISEIMAQLEIDETQRQSGINDFNLQNMLKHLGNIRSNLRQGLLPPKNFRSRNLSRLVLDSWPLGTGLGKSISDFETYFLSIG